MAIHDALPISMYRHKTKSNKPPRANRPGPQLYTLVPNQALSCDLFVVPEKTDPPRHFQEWSFQIHRTYQYLPHPPQVQKKQLHVTRGPDYPPCTGHFQGCTKQSIQCPSPGAHVHKLRIRPVPLPHPKRPNEDIQPSSFKV